MAKKLSANKIYQRAGGNFETSCKITLKKEADLAGIYYPGINDILTKIAEKPTYQQKYCRLGKTIGVISTKGPQEYPLLTAKAALLSQVADINAIPLMVRYQKIQKLAEIIECLSVNFQMLYCVGFSQTEKKVFEEQYRGEIPYLFDDQAEAAAVIASLNNVSKMLGKGPKKLQIAVEGIDDLTDDIVHLLKDHQFEQVTLIDERGPLYRKRPNMNQRKNDLADIINAKKDERSYEQVLSQTDVYLCSYPQAIKSNVTSLLGAKAVILSLKSESIEQQNKQSIISTLPELPNHLTDLHITAGIATALTEGKNWSKTTLQSAIKGLSDVYKSPKATRLFPGLLEKNLATKIAKAVK